MIDLSTIRIYDDDYDKGDNNDGYDCDVVDENDGC